MDTPKSIEDDQISELFVEIWQELYKTQAPPPVNKVAHVWDSLSLLGLSGVVYVLFLL